MTDPTTSNVLLAVPTRGSDSGTWDVPVNSNSTALDGFLGGVQTISVTNANVTLTAPAGTVTATSGPTQSQNRILKFTGALSANVQVTFPLPGNYTIQNLTTGAFVLSFKSGSGNIVATPQGSVMQVWNDGTDCWLLKNQIPGALTFMGGISAVPAWINACTIKPFLLCDGTVYNISSYSALGTLYGSNFGGNGVSTFGVQDLRGRVPLAYDGTGTRITSAGCNINGQTMGAAGGDQNIEQHTHAFTGTPGTVNVTDAGPYLKSGSPIGVQSGSGAIAGQSGNSQFQAVNASGSFTPAGTIANFGTGSSGNIPPAQVSGIWLVAT